jgi:hypothetical protein
MPALHIFAALFSFSVVFAADKEALSWMRGKKQTLQVKRLRTFHILTWCGLLALAFTGAILSYPMLSFLLSQPLFIMKLLFVATLFVNAVLIGKLSSVATERPFSNLSVHDRMRLMTSGAVSSFSWIAALILALLVFQ